VSGSWRYFGCAVGFGFGVVWMTLGASSAILVLLCGALGFGVAFLAEHERAAPDKLRPETQIGISQADDEDEPLLRDDFRLDEQEHQDEELPAEELAPLVADGDYGWPSRSS
jgi:hypothetical protein